jgi:hypothetical protein
MNAPLPRLPEIEQITREIHTLEAHAMQRAQRAVEFKVEIGKRLARAKAILKRGKFGAWAQKEFGWGHWHVARRMQLARNYPRVGNLGQEASLRAALADIAQAQNGRKSDVAEAERVPAARYRLVLMWPWPRDQPGAAGGRGRRFGAEGSRRRRPQAGGGGGVAARFSSLVVSFRPKPVSVGL